MNIKLNGKSKLGNFLIQIKNSIHIALYYNYNVILPKHQFLNTTYLIINKNITCQNNIITDESDFFYQDRIQNIDISLFDINKDEVINIMKDIFTIKNITPLGNNDLLIHIRSGDIFENITPHCKYLTPPLSYYVNIIEHNNYENIYLISKDTLNPCINKLIEIYPKIIFKLQTLEQDIKMILAAVNIVISFGTFVPELLDISNNKNNIYCPSYFIYINSKCVIHITDLDEYYNSMIPWKNTTEQKEQMLKQ